MVVVILTFLFLLGLHFLVLKMLTMMDEVPLIGLLLKNYLLSAVLLCLMGMLVFSNLINALSAFFLSRELELVFASPLRFRTIFSSKFCEVMFRSSWMVIILLIPVLSAYWASYGGQALFFFIAIPLLLPYLMTCSAAGILGALLLAVVLPVKKAATVLRFVFVIGIELVIVLLRILQPEQLVVPERFESFGRFLLTLHSPFANQLPSYWLSKVLLCSITGDYFGFEEYLLPYLLLCLLSLGLSYWLAKMLYMRAWRRMQLSHRKDSPPQSQRSLPSLVARLASTLSRSNQATARMIEKEVLIFLRTPAIWTQVALLSVIVVIYLYNIHLLPADSLSNLRADLPSITAFCNIAFIGFITTAAALRFGFPAVSMEGRALFLILVSPLSTEAYLRVKYWTSAVPLTALAVMLAVTSSILLDTSPLITALVIVDVTLLSLGISSLALLLGTVYADIEAHNFAEIPSGWGGMLFMLASMVFIGVFLAFQAYPFYLHFLTSTSLYQLKQGEIVTMAACFVLSLCSFGILEHQARQYCHLALKRLG